MITMLTTGSVAREQFRLIFITTISPLLGFYTPLKTFLLALILMFGFNIWCGMRADGVAISRCKNFSMKKFKHALVELTLYLIIITIIYTVMTLMGDRDTSLTVVKSLSYVFMYVYAQNAFRNLIIAYPTVTAFHMIYHIIRLEFKRALPTHIREVVARFDSDKTDFPSAYETNQTSPSCETPKVHDADNIETEPQKVTPSQNG